MLLREYGSGFNVPLSVRNVLLLLLPLAVLMGCKTSTVESRIEERSAAYAGLPAEVRADVDAGRIRVGMNSDAVYMAWGQPAQILESETGQGHVTTWLYEGGWMQEQRYWAYRTVGTGRHACAERYLAREYYPRAYIRAEITFVDGAVNQWRTLPRPTY
jgi:hypothetical protein